MLGDDGGKATNDFVIDQGGKLHFLRERGKPDTPSLVVRHGPVVGRNVAFDLAVTDEHGVEISVYAGMYATREYVGDIANWFNPLLDVPQT